MPEVQEVFRMATQKVRPDPGALERQERGQRRRMVRRKMAAIGFVAALLAVAALFAVRIAGGTNEQMPLSPGPSSTAAPEAAALVGTVTFDGKTCSLELTGDPIAPGAVVFEVVNATDQLVMFDSYQLSEGYTFPTFAAAVEHLRRTAEKGEQGSGFPEVNQEAIYLGSELVSANDSGLVALTAASGRYAIVCLTRFEGVGMEPSGIVGPIRFG